MGNLWLKIKLWTKVVIFAAVALLLILLLWGNRSVTVSPRLDLVIKEYKEPNFLLVTLCTSVLSIVGWWLLRAGFKAIRQFKKMRERTRTERMEKELADMKAKAAKLQTRPENSGSKQEPADDQP